MAYATFVQGASVFSCDCCGRRTRHTTQDRSRKDCAECFDLAGLQNMEWDGMLTAGDVKERDALLACIQAKGGDTDRVKAEFPDLFAVSA